MNTQVGLRVVGVGGGCVVLTHPRAPTSQKRQQQHKELMRKWPTLYGDADREAAEALGRDRGVQLK